MSNRVRVNWFLVWLSLYAITYPFLSFLLSIVSPAFPLPAAVFAANLAVGQTALMAWTLARIKVARAALPPAQAMLPLRQSVSLLWRKALIWLVVAVSVFIIGLLARLVVGRPAWRMLAVFSLAIPTSLLLADFLPVRSRFPEANAEAGAQGGA